MNLKATKAVKIRGRSTRVLLAASGALVVVALSVTTIVGSRAAPPAAEGAAQVDKAIAAAFAGTDCLTPTDATAAMQAIVDERDPAGAWTITLAPGAAAAPCVTAGMDAEGRAIVLIPIAGSGVVAVNDALAKALMDRCLGRDAAIGFVASVLSGSGVRDVSIRTDGPFAYPAAEEAAVRGHVAAGCFVFSGTGSDAAGRPVYYLSGPTE